MSTAALHLDRSIYRDRLGDPSTWTGDWRRPGNYLVGDQQEAVRARMGQHHAMLLGMAIRGHRSKTIAAVFCVSRESVDRRLRPLGFRNAPGQVGRPANREKAIPVPVPEIVVVVPRAPARAAASVVSRKRARLESPRQLWLALDLPV